MGYNMSYCRHANTLGALDEVWEQWDDEPESDLSDGEQRARRGLKRLIHEMYWDLRENGDYPEDDEEEN